MVSIITLMDTVSELRRTVRQRFMKEMKTHQIDITIEMLEVLRLLWNRDERRQNEIVELTSRNKASITSLVDNLVARGLVVRKSDAKDRRSNLVALTDEGRNYRQRLNPLVTNLYNAVSEEFSEEELGKFTTDLKRIEHLLKNE